MKKSIVLLGGNALNIGIYNKFHNNGYNVYVVDWNDNPAIVGDKHYQIDVKDSERVVSILKDDGVLDSVLFAYTSIDKAVKTAAEIDKAVGLSTIPYNVIENVQSKSNMTRLWNEEGLLNRYSASFESFANEISVVNGSKDVIFKPDDSASSRGITVVPQKSSFDSLRNAFFVAKEESTSGKVIVEECIEGVEYTADMAGDLYGNVEVCGISKKTHTENAGNNRISVKLHYNCIPEDLCLTISKAAIACYKALGMSCSFGHLELIVKPDGTVSPIEIAARSSGFIASDLVNIVMGKDYFEEVYRAKKGERLKNGLARQTNKSSVYFFYDFPSDMVIKHECCLTDFLDKSIISRYHDRSKIKTGNRFSTITSDNERYGYEILEGPKDLLTPEYLAACEKKMMAAMAENF